MGINGCLLASPMWESIISLHYLYATILAYPQHEFYFFCNYLSSHQTHHFHLVSFSLVYVGTNSLSPCVLVILLDISLLEAGHICGCIDHFSSIFLEHMCSWPIPRWGELEMLWTCSPGNEVGSIPEVGGDTNISELESLPTDIPQAPRTSLSLKQLPTAIQFLDQSLRFSPMLPMVTDPFSEPALPVHPGLNWKSQHLSEKKGPGDH